MSPLANQLTDVKRRTQVKPVSRHDVSRERDVQVSDVL